MNTSIRIVKRTQIESVKGYHAGDFVPPKMAPQYFRPTLEGKGAEMDFRQGVLRESDWSSMLSHRDPTQGVPLTPRPMTNVAIELVPSWHKSVPILALCYPGLLKANAELARRAVGLTEDFAFCRKEKKGVTSTLPAFGLWAAVFPHLLSDAGDPLLHSHDLIFLFSRFDANEGHEGSLGSVWTSPIIANQDLLSARIAAEGGILLAGLGLDLERDNRSFRIPGVPRELETVYSRRTNEVDTAEIDARAAGQEYVDRQTMYVERRRPKEFKTLDNQWQRWLSIDVGAEYEKTLCLIRDEAIWRCQHRPADFQVGSVERTRDSLAQYLASSDLVSPSSMEISVLRGLPGEASASIFATAIGEIQPQQVTTGGHDFLVGGQMRSMLPDLDALAGRISEGKQRQLAGTRSTVSQFAIQSATERILLIEAPNPKLTTRACAQLAQDYHGNRPVKVLDASSLTSRELAVVLHNADAGTERLVLVAPHPSRTTCAAASALACSDLVSNPATVLRESTTPHTLPCELNTPPAVRAVEADSWDIDKYVTELLETSDTAPLFITPTQALAREINALAHGRTPKTIVAPRLRTSERIRLLEGELSDVSLAMPQPGFAKGDVVIAQAMADWILLSDGANTQAEIPLHRQSELRFLDAEDVAVGSEEPVFILKRFSAESPFEPVKVVSRIVGKDIASEAGKTGWAVGFAASLEELPSRPFQSETVVWCGGDAKLSTPHERKLRAYMHLAENPVTLSTVRAEGLARLHEGIDQATPKTEFSTNPPMEDLEHPLP